MSRLLTILICTLFYSTIYSQELFEHLTHKDGNSFVVSYLPTDDGIFYHSNNGSSNIRFISFDNESELLWTSNKLVSYWSEFTQLDGADWVLYMSNIVEYDLLYSELWVFKYIDGQLTQEVIEFNNGPYYFDGATDMQYINENSVLMAIGPYLIELNENHEVVNYVQHDLGYGALLHENQFYEKYLTGKPGKIYSIGTDLELNLKNDTGFEITHISSIGDNKTMVGTEKSITVFNSDCTIVISSFDTPSGGEFLNLVGLSNYNTYALEKLNDEYLIWNLNPDGDFNLLHSETCEELEYRKIAFHNDFIYEVGQMNRLAQFKSISIDSNFDDQVERPEISLDDFQVYLKEEYEDNGTPFNNYYFEVQWTNTGDAVITCYDLFISYIPSVIMPTLGTKVSVEDQLINPGETINIDGWFTINMGFVNWNNPNYEPNELYLPGANNLPVCSNNIIIDDEILSNEELDQTFEINFNLFPNPAHQILNVRNLTRGEILYIHNVHGKRIWSGRTTNNFRTIDVSSFQSGLYFVTNGMNSQSFIKH